MCDNNDNALQKIEPKKSLRPVFLYSRHWNPTHMNSGLTRLTWNLGRLGSKIVSGGTNGKSLKTRVDLSQLGASGKAPLKTFDQ